MPGLVEQYPLVALMFHDAGPPGSACQRANLDAVGRSAAVDGADGVMNSIDKPKPGASCLRSRAACTFSLHRYVRNFGGDGFSATRFRGSIAAWRSHSNALPLSSGELVAGMAFHRSAASETNHVSSMVAGRRCSRAGSLDSEGHAAIGRVVCDLPRPLWRAWIDLGQIGS